MNLRKQLFASFLGVAFLPLIVITFYIFATNLLLAFNLHEKNLKDSTQIQADLVDDNLNRLMVRARQFASSQNVRSVCRAGSVDKDRITAELSDEILNFTDETLDNVEVFALLDQKGEFLYSSGSNNDSISLQEKLPKPLIVDRQHISEITFSDLSNSLIIYTPVQEAGQTVGTFLVVCRTDYLLKLISSHRQLESSNMLIYCRTHKAIIASKQDVSGTLPELDKKADGSSHGSLFFRFNRKWTLAYYQDISKTPWMLVSTVSTEQIFSLVRSYGFINVIVLVVVLLIILFLSHLQSRRILYPMDQLLEAVEKFFLNSDTKFTRLDIAPKSELGYLAEKFAGLSDEISLAQGKLQESNYLYTALLKATYEFRIVIDYQLDTLECSSSQISELLTDTRGENASERLKSFLKSDMGELSDEAVLAGIAYGSLTEPEELETCISKEAYNKKKWYRVVAVPVLKDGRVQRAALHFEDITDKKLEELRLIQSSQTDPLCGLYNKTAFPIHCLLPKGSTSYTTFFIDLDKFKQVNDTLGHAAGDEVLVSAAQAIRAQFRESDVIGRLGGDEFAVFAPGINEATARKKAAQLVRAISFHLETPQNTVIHVTASVGICMANPSIPLEQSIHLADEAMYHAKENGRTQFFLIRPDQQI